MYVGPGLIESGWGAASRAVSPPALEHPRVVQERLGHSTMTLTLDAYTHVVPGMQELASLRLEKLLKSAGAGLAQAL